MESSIGKEICVFPKICNALRSPSSPPVLGNNFNLEIDILANHSYTCGDNNVEECQFGTRWKHKYKPLLWDIVDIELSVYHFSYLLENLFVLCKRHLLFHNDDTIYVSLIFAKNKSLSPQEFQLTQARIFAEHYESTTVILWPQVRATINILGCGSPLYEEFQCLEGYVVEIVRHSINWRMCIDENCE
ncbi:hypothetical protein H5410_026587 [Solanum commersonii]|uniref:Uncharacterized protein n=1 Tax=Solanum commersonii TaxID=4109 RepID=A0A9J5YZF6_SOLCO|nr:hypothetical protein H5410_026587 [Solanum commersonii]